MADLRLLLTLIWIISGELCQIARPLLQNKMCGFREGYSPEMADLCSSLTNICNVHGILTWLVHPSPSAARFPVDEPALASIMTHYHAKNLCASELGPLRI